jgi:hypothetical protein
MSTIQFFEDVYSTIAMIWKYFNDKIPEALPNLSKITPLEFSQCIIFFQNIETFLDNDLQPILTSNEKVNTAELIKKLKSMNGSSQRIDFEKQYLKHFHLNSLKSLKAMLEYEPWTKKSITQEKFE